MTSTETLSWIAICLSTLSMVATCAMSARSQERWIDELRAPSSRVACCSSGDGQHLYVGDWKRVHNEDGDHFEIEFMEGWSRVPPEAVVTEKNRDGIARVWSTFADGKRYIRCFLAGAES